MAYNVWETCMLVPGISVAHCSGWAHVWASVIGLAVAIGVPWWQRHADRQHARRFQLAAAELVAAGVLAQNLRIIAVLDNLQTRWKNRRGFIIPSAVIGHILNKVQTMDSPTDELLLPMAAIWPIHVRQIAIAYHSIRIAVAKMEHLAMILHAGRTVTLEQINDVMNLLGLARDNLAMAECGIRPQGSGHIRLQ